MSYSAQWSCDGCDTAISTPGERPQSLVTTSVKVHTGKADSKPSTGSFDLCDRCLAQLKDISNPRNWPRNQHQPRKWFGLAS